MSARRNWETTDASRSEIWRAVTDVTCGLWITGNSHQGCRVREKSCHFNYNARLRCSSADKFAPASSSRPVRKAQNIRLTESAKGP